MPFQKINFASTSNLEMVIRANELGRVRSKPGQAKNIRSDQTKLP